MIEKEAITSKEKTHIQKVWPLIWIMRLAGLLSFLHILGFSGQWQLDIIAGLCWFILAVIEEGYARLRDIQERGLSFHIRNGCKAIQTEPGQWIVEWNEEDSN